jgi:hypothetical protein
VVCITFNADQFAILHFVHHGTGIGAVMWTAAVKITILINRFSHVLSPFSLFKLNAAP